MRRWVLLSVLFLIVVGTFGYVVYESTRPPAPTSSATAPSCTPLQLSGSASWEGISGGLVGAIQLTNTSPSACTFTPENFSIASNGQTLSINQVASSSGAVLLQPSTSARTQFVWRNWCAPLLTAPAQIGINLPNGETFSVPVLGPSGTPQSNTPQCDNMEASSTLFVSTFLEGGGGVTAYTSQMLGISFEYDSSQASVLEQGNTIYVYPIGAPSTGGDLIEMFSKFPGETLQQSITRQLLTGTTSSACAINVSSSNTYQGGYFEAQIVASSSGQTEPTCDSEYLAQGDSQFFLYDINYPDEFFFFNVSSSTILAAGEEPWQDTAEILK